MVRRIPRFVTVAVALLLLLAAPVAAIAFASACARVPAVPVAR